MKKLISVILSIVLPTLVAYAQTPTKVKECVEWVPVKVPVKYVCGTELFYVKDKNGKVVDTLVKDVWCTKYEDTVKCTKWVDVETSTGTAK